MSIEQAHSNPFDRAIKSGNTWEDRRDVLMEKLVERTKSMVGFIDGVRSIKSNASLKTTKEKLDEACVAAKAHIPADAYVKETLLRKTSEKVEELYAKLPESLDAEYGKEEVDLCEKIGKLQVKIDEFMNDPDVAYLENLDKTVKSLIAKRMKVMEVGATDSLAIHTFIEEVSKPESLKLRKTDFTKVLRATFDISLYTSISKLNPRPAENGTTGVHMFGTVFNLIGEGTGSESTVRHEQIHNLIDASEHLRHSFPKDDLLWKIRLRKKSNALIEDATPKERRQMLNVTYTKFFEGLSSKAFVNDLHNEVLAHLEIAERRLAQPYYGLNEEETRLHFFKSEFRHETVASNFHDHLSTATGQVRELALVRDELLKLKVDDIVLQRFDEFRARVLKRFEGMGSVLAQSFDLVTRLPGTERSHDELIALCVLLKPGDYENAIPRYLKHRHGENVIEDAKLSQRIELNRLVSSKDLESALDLLEKNALSEKTSQCLRKEFQVFNKQHNPKWRVLSNVRHYVASEPDMNMYFSLLSRVASRIGIAEENIQYFQREVSNTRKIKRDQKP